MSPSSSNLGGCTLKEYWKDVAERGRKGPGPKIIKLKFSNLDFSKGRKEYNPDHFLEELGRITGSKEISAYVRDSYHAMVNSSLTHGRDVCKYVGTEPPKKGGSNTKQGPIYASGGTDTQYGQPASPCSPSQIPHTLEPPKKGGCFGGSKVCGICDGEHGLAGCPYWVTVPPDAYIGPCFVLLCERCGSSIETTRFCLCRRGPVKGRISQRLCDCCCQTMWSGCRCHFLSECSTSSISEPGQQPVPPPQED
ncbi:hypothetical protein OROMI_027035 [Orobanche minor]